MPPERRKFVHDVRPSSSSSPLMVCDLNQLSLQLAAVYRMDTVMVDQEPHRSVQLIRRIDTRIPVPLLSQHIASTQSAMGRLVDVRLGTRGAGVSGVTAATAGVGAGGSVWGGASGASGGIGTSAGGSAGPGRWNMVAKSALGAPVPRSGSGTPVRVPSPAVQSREASPGPGRRSGVSAAASASGGGSTGASVGAGVGVGTSGGGRTKGGAWVSPTVQALRGKESVVGGSVPVAPAVVEGQDIGVGVGIGVGQEEVKDVPNDWEDDV